MSEQKPDVNDEFEIIGEEALFCYTNKKLNELLKAERDKAIGEVVAIFREEAGKCLVSKNPVEAVNPLTLLNRIIKLLSTDESKE